MSKNCPFCDNSNPDTAKFCRVCGNALEISIPDNIKINLSNYLKGITKFFNSLWSKSGQGSQPTHAPAKRFTPNDFPSIQFSPKSVVKVRFYNRFLLFLWIIDLIAFYISGEYSWDIIQSLYIDPDLYFYVIHMGLFVVGLLLTIWVIKRAIKKIIFYINVDYLENERFVNDLIRVAKSNGLGLFDNKKKKVRLRSRYESIELFEDDYLLIKRNGLFGVYSIPLRKAIIPIKYNRIEHFRNSMAKAKKGNEEHHYDIKGNRLS